MLTGKQRSYLRGEGNRLDPIVHIGKDGLTPAIIEQIDQALSDHELIKIRILNNSLEEVEPAAEILTDQLDAEIVQKIGSVMLIYRRNSEEPVYQLP